MRGSQKMDHKERVKMYMRKIELEEEEEKLRTEFKELVKGKKSLPAVEELDGFTTGELNA